MKITNKKSRTRPMIALGRANGLYGMTINENNK